MATYKLLVLIITIFLSSNNITSYTATTEILSFKAKSSHGFIYMILRMRLRLYILVYSYILYMRVHERVCVNTKKDAIFFDVEIDIYIHEHIIVFYQIF